LLIDDASSNGFSNFPASKSSSKSKSLNQQTPTPTTKLSPNECTILLGLLYFIQGFPYGFQDKLIPLLLIIKGHSPSTIGFIRLLLLPWLMKALFAPLIDMVNFQAKNFSKLKL
ncbi:hypothetical protein BLA29_011020, partial [Euroglyphus maynei]